MQWNRNSPNALITFKNHERPEYNMQYYYLQRLEWQYCKKCWRVTARTHMVLQLQLMLRTATVHHAAHFRDKMATVCRRSASSYSGPMRASRRERPATNCSTIVDITRRNDFTSGSDRCRPASSSVVRQYPWMGKAAGIRERRVWNFHLVRIE